MIWRKIVKMKNTIYLDNAATTRPENEVIEIISELQKNSYGNPSSLHSLGINAEDYLDNARKMIAITLNAKENQIIFTGSGTESNNLAIKGFLKNKKGKIITSKIEHPSIFNVFKSLEKDFDVVYLNVDSEGFIDLDQLEKEIDEHTLFVSIIHGNNEIGTIQDIKKISEIIKEKNPKTIFHTDACQSFTKTDIDVLDLGIDMITLNAHKIHGPKGVGALFVKDRSLIQQIVQGGHQESDKRPGTENVPSILGFAKATEIAMNKKDENVSHIKKLQKLLIEKISNEISDVELNGPKNLDKRLCNNINFTFKFIEGEGLLMLLNEQGICVSTGSACSSKVLEASHVILALGKKHKDAHGTIRFSLSKFNTEKEINYTVEKLKEAVIILRKISHITPN